MQVQAQDRIAQLAYELWEQRGCPQGSPEVDWERACRMLEAGSTPDNEVLSVPTPVNAAGNAAPDRAGESGATASRRDGAGDTLGAPAGGPSGTPRPRGKSRPQRRSAI